MKANIVENEPTATMNFWAPSLLIAHLPTLVDATILYCVNDVSVATLSFNFNDFAITAIVILL
jgi:hypothetical protein